MIYLYAVVDDAPDLSGVTGVSDEPLSAISISGFVIIGSEVTAPPALSAQALTRQDHAVRLLHDRSTALLPMRFGTVFSTHADVARAVDLQAAGLRERLALVRDREQMNIRVFGRARSSPAPSSGADYLRDRARPSELTPWLDAVGHLVRQTSIERSRTPGLIATAYHLIDRGHGEAYREQLRGIERPGLSAQISGPGPCYAFASAI